MGEGQPQLASPHSVLHLRAAIIDDAAARALTVARRTKVRTLGQKLDRGRFLEMPTISNRGAREAELVPGKKRPSRGMQVRSYLPLCMYGGHYGAPPPPPLRSNRLPLSPCPSTRLARDKQAGPRKHDFQGAGASPIIRLGTGPAIDLVLRQFTKADVGPVPRTSSEYLPTACSSSPSCFCLSLTHCAPCHQSRAPLHTRLVHSLEP